MGVDIGKFMKDALGIILLGIGGYVLYEWLYGSSTQTQTVTMATPTVPPSVTTANSTQNTTVGSTSGNQAGQNSQPNVSQSTLAAMLLAAANNNSIMVSQGMVGSVSQWNYLFTQVTGDSVDVLVDYPADTGGNIDLATYLQWRQNVGLAGLCGLGRVYMSGWAGRGFGGLDRLDGLGSFYMSPNFPTGLNSEPYYPTFSHPGLGIVGQGYGINQNRINAGASFYELADKRFL